MPSISIVRSSSILFLLLAAPQALAVDRPVAARLHQVKRYASTGVPKTGKLVAKPVVKGSTFAIPAVGGPADPTIHGGSLRFFRIGTPGDWPLRNLRDSRWQALGVPAGSKGFRYVGRGSIGDPCRSVLVTPKSIKAVCRTFNAFDRFAYEMPVDPGPGMGFELNVGDDRYCAESSAATGAEFRKNGALLVKAVRASAPGTCPIVSTPTPTPTPTATPTPVYGSAARAFVERPQSLLP